VEQNGQQRSIAGAEPDRPVAELTLQHGELVPQHQDLSVLVVVAAGEQPQQRNHVRDTKVGQA
jgi:hypothetical protein